ncbi:unnamed protein product [Caenorhabditis angaria]|uniref:Uncharacterized protein n=1 Tax=Caenorhabditis angaria TaxID=860376 RepID=A0A9P1IYL4_9PELO|nr:unnamed protein product [Caenorhabditis angaria]
MRFLIVLLLISIGAAWAGYGAPFGGGFGGGPYGGFGGGPGFGGGGFQQSGSNWGRSSSFKQSVSQSSSGFNNNFGSSGQFGGWGRK